MTNLSKGNARFKSGDFKSALFFYDKSMQDDQVNLDLVKFNVNILKNRLGREEFLEITKGTSFHNLEPLKTIESKKVKIKGKKNFKGSINTISEESTFINGWALKEKDLSEKSYLLILDGNKKYEVVADKFRADLAKAKIGDAHASFSFSIPPEFYDNKKHIVELYSKNGVELIDSKDFILKQEKKFNDFSEMLRYSMLNPIITTPFDEEKKRCLAFSDVIAKNLEKTVTSYQDVKVSVIMAVYNREDIVERSIISVLSQTYKNFELIIVDDASIDKSVFVIKKFKDKRIKLIQQKENKGKAAAVNVALKQATGDWIAYLDSDNTWDKKFLASMIGATKKEPGCEAAFSGQLLFRGDSQQPYAARLASYNKNLLLNRNYIDHNSFIHKAEIINKVGMYDESLRRCLDYDFIIRVAKYCEMISVPVLLTNYYYELADNAITSDYGLNEYVDLVRERAQNMLLDSNWVSDFVSKNKVGNYPANKMSIIIPSWESLEDISKCIKSIECLDEKDLVEIIVVDNNSSELVVDYLKSLASSKKIKLILNKENYGFTHAVNQGIEISEPDRDIVLLNNDAEVINGSLELLSRYSNMLEDSGLLVPAQILYPETKTMNTHVPFLSPKMFGDVNISVHHKNISKINTLEKGNYIEIDFAPFFCVYIPRRTLNKIGPLDAELGRHYRSDRLYCNSVRNILNEKIYYIPDSRVLHGLQKSTDSLKSSDTSAFDIMFKKNWWQEELMEQLGFERRSWDM